MRFDIFWVGRADQLYPAYAFWRVGVDPAGETVNGLAGGKNIGRSGKQVLAWTPVGVDDLLKCQRDPRRTLYFVYDDGQVGRRRLLGKGLELAKWISFKRGTNAIVVQRKVAAG
jgi:hypothetical protein